ncbi:Paramyosin, short form [Orchesella cincta]|uniref:Paramyosin, short form n=1 Tax=Orchesella cincta TaxID=48709 RepID=A0A1D2NG10_ORCCI|nr:Paramyosin, short form [Orchesella cincta]
MRSLSLISQTSLTNLRELEMSLDVANKNNIELQKTVKKYSISLTELQSHYDEVQRQLQIALDQYGQATRRAAALQGELDEVRNSLEASLRAKRAVEQSLEETASRVNELTTINVNLASHRTKLEQELSIISSDYDEVSKELKLSDERYQKVSVEYTRTVDILHEEQERVVKIESIKKSLEIEVKNLSVRLEEVEANALVNGKRIISKLEGRLRDLEMELDEEKRRHSETIKILRKKERHVKEIMISIEEQNQQIALLQEALDKVGHKANCTRGSSKSRKSLAATNVTVSDDSKENWKLQKSVLTLRKVTCPWSGKTPFLRHL